MNIGNFYFISDNYFTDFPDDKLMTNKEVINGKAHGRPCYYTIKDNKTPFSWVIPISSQVAKYQRIYDDKVKKNGSCDTIHFGHVLGEMRAFLIQNMCPVTNEYISNQYINSSTGTPVVISKKLADEVEHKARKILRLHRRGIKLIFPDVSAIETALLAKIQQS
ncbi:type III toxin-antitoxin system CptIN family toxin [Pelosinus propionicus]|uniref:Uncharacterized protein n=1 Tax=Pelosinus propionicus DSM 13327 TaxID=1123291 RepID=A0A1I4QEM8_9FIRM|nr:hypothetical protein [Pelosinus propionicus]SFM38529.1 hypothetical protein SAMN04490355_10973 [Pelosinus propionicus DSM 13327]